MSASGTRAMSAFTPATVLRSAATPETRAPAAAARTLSTAVRTRGSVRPFRTTAAPSRDNASAMAKPMPAVDPVTTAVFPVSCRSTAAPSRLLLGRADQELVHGDAARAGHDVRDGVRDVFRLEPLDAGEAAHRLLADLRAQVARQLRGDGARLDERDAHVPAGDLLAQRFAERTDPGLRQVV